MLSVFGTGIRAGLRVFRQRVLRRNNLPPSHPFQSASRAGVTRGLLDAASADLASQSGSASANHDSARPENQECHLLEEQDATAQAAVAVGRLFGAKSARDAAEMTLGRPMTEEEWMQFQEPWERNWKS